MLFSATSSRYRGPNQSKNSVHGKFTSKVFSMPSAHAVSYVHVRATFLTVYPPPPSNMRGIFVFLKYWTQYACPSIVRLKHPSLSPANESAPHCRTTTEGR